MSSFLRLKSKPNKLAGSRVSFFQLARFAYSTYSSTLKVETVYVFESLAN
jgi:hypothetical protein